MGISAVLAAGAGKDCTGDCGDVSRAGSARLSSTEGAAAGFVALASGFAVPQKGQKRTLSGSSMRHSRQLSISKERVRLFGFAGAGCRSSRRKR